MLANDKESYFEILRRKQSPLPKITTDSTMADFQALASGFIAFSLVLLIFGAPVIWYLIHANKILSRKIRDLEHQLNGDGIKLGNLENGMTLQQRLVAQDHDIMDLAVNLELKRNQKGNCEELIEILEGDLRKREKTIAGLKVDNTTLKYQLAARTKDLQMMLDVDTAKIRNSALYSGRSDLTLPNRQTAARSVEADTQQNVVLGRHNSVQAEVVGAQENPFSIGDDSDSDSDSDDEGNSESVADVIRRSVAPRPTPSKIPLPDSESEGSDAYDDEDLVRG